MRRVFVLCSAFLIVAFPLFSETFNRAKLNEAITHVDASEKFKEDGKSVKAEREASVAEIILRKNLKTNVKYRFPENCTFAYPLDMYQHLSVSCDEFADVSFSIEEPDQKILEILEDCKDNCTGEFYFIPLNRYVPKQMAWLYSVDSKKKITLKIKLINAKAGKKLKIKDDEPQTKIE